MKKKQPKILLLVVALVVGIICQATVVANVWVYCPDFECDFGSCENCESGWNFQEQDFCCFSCLYWDHGAVTTEYCCDPYECNPK